MHSSQLIKHFYPSYFIWDIPSETDDIYLTFDDGPVNGITHKVLNILDDFEIKATFFCVGENVVRHNDVFLELLSKGHAVGNHTYNHLKGWKTNFEDYIYNVDICNKLVGVPLFRPPYGRITRKQAALLKDNYKIIMWSVLSYDFDQKLNAAKCLKKSIDKTRKGCIIVFHDNVKAEKNLIYTLPRYIEHFKKKNYNFKTL